jgi:peptidoglycan-associated lipoprotein
VAAVFGLGSACAPSAAVERPSHEASPVPVEVAPDAGVTWADDDPGPVSEAAPSTSVTGGPEAMPCATRLLDGDGFASGRWEVPDAIEGRLAEIARWLIERRYSSIRITGHTDRRPSSIGNDVLSRNRAEAVRARLAELGVPDTLMTDVGGGDAYPLDPGDDEAAWARNRRVEITAFC